MLLVVQVRAGMQASVRRPRPRTTDTGRRAGAPQFPCNAHWFFTELTAIGSWTEEPERAIIGASDA